MPSENPVVSRRVIFTADDFGVSRSVNEAVRRAHGEGVLTCASLMVGGEGWREAVAIARDSPDLGVGWHLTLCDGCSVLPRERIPDLVDAQGRFLWGPAETGWLIFSNADVRRQAGEEIRAQLERFQETGLVMDHVNGHLNIHLHPSVLHLLLADLPRPDRVAWRLTRDPLGLNLTLSRGRLGYRLSHAAIFAMLSRWARPRLDAQGGPYADRVLGLLQSGHMNFEYVAGGLAASDWRTLEVYFHPGAADGSNDLETLLDTRFPALLKRLDLRRVRHQDL